MPTSTHDTDAIAKAIKATLISPNVSDNNGESANVVDSLDRIASAIFYLAEAVEKLVEAQHERE